MVRVSVGNDAWYYNRANRAQSLYDVSRFVEPPHMDIASG